MLKKSSTSLVKKPIVFGLLYNLIAVFFTLKMPIEIVLVPLVDGKRRDDQIDNAFDSKFSIKGFVVDDHLHSPLKKIKGPLNNP